jgi:hypothetical protein
VSHRGPLGGPRGAYDFRNVSARSRSSIISLSADGVSPDNRFASSMPGPAAFRTGGEAVEKPQPDHTMIMERLGSFRARLMG